MRRGRNAKPADNAEIDRASQGLRSDSPARGSFPSRSQTRPRVSILTVLTALTGLTAFPQDIPKGYSVERYRHLWERNPFTFVTPVAALPQPGVFDKLVLLSWLKDGGNYIIFVQNTETNEVRKIGTQPDINNLRLVEVRANQNTRLVEAVISNGQEEGRIKFRAEQPTAGTVQVLAGQPRQRTQGIQRARPSRARPPRRKRLLSPSDRARSVRPAQGNQPAAPD
jgi:hypothetical protein